MAPPARPWIVVGDRDKLGTQGPTLGLLRAADDALKTATNLVVVGYSFGDSHINQLVGSWLNSSPERTITLLDVRFDSRNIFTNELVNALGADSRSLRDSRVCLLAGTAGTRLAEALQARPDPMPAEYAITHSSTVIDGVRATTLQLLGPRLHDVNLSMSEETIMYAETRAMMPVRTRNTRDEVLELSGNEYRETSVERNTWETGEHVTIYSPASGTIPRRLHVRASRLDARHAVEFNIAVA
jgi:hypothetical protein